MTAIESQQYSVSTTRVQIALPQSMTAHLCIHNHEHSTSKNIYVGDANLTTSTGLHIPADETLHLDIPPGIGLWAISDSDGAALQILRVIQ